jgi:phosphoglycerate dehydrogenase-like enzyme
MTAMKDDLKILVALEPYEPAMERLRKLIPRGEIRVGAWITDPKTTLPPDLMRGADVLFCELPPANFDDFDCLKLIQVESAGYAQVLKLPILQRGIRVCNGLGNFDIPIAEWVVMTMIMCHRHMPEMFRNQQAGRWDRDKRFQAEMRGSVVGFYGYGGLARESTRILKAMGLTVWALTRDGSTRKREMKYVLPGTGDPDGVLPDRVFATAQTGEFLRGLDFLVVAVPITNVTKGIIGERELRMLKPSAVLINPARAPIVDEQALLRCMREKWIRAAAFDVHYAYPLPPEHPLWSMPNVILTPHISGSAASTHFMERAYDIFVQNVERYAAGKPLLNELSESQLRGE